MKKLDYLRHNMAVNIIGAIIFLLVLSGVIVSTLGYRSFTLSFKKEYSASTYHMADTAASLVNGDHLDEYLAGEEESEYKRTKRILDGFCYRMNVSLVYVIQVDPSDYGRFVSIFNSVNNSVDDSEYREWEPGHRRDTTNDEYRRKYRALYEQESPYETVYRLNPANGQHPHITAMVPVIDSSGNTAAILCVERPVSEITRSRLPYVRNVAISTVLLCILSSILAAMFIRRQFVDPIRRVSKEATRFARENTRGRELGSISRYKELADLAGSIDTMETEMVRYIENLTTVTADKERMATELSLAARIQAAMLPHDFPPYPDRQEFDLFASMNPAREVGGDFYDFFLIDEDHLCLVMADVSGKGIPGALFMMASMIILKSCAMLGNSASEILNLTNEAICSNNAEDMFVTVWLGILELSSGRLTAANAGHEYPVLKRPEGGFELYKDRHGLVIGAMEDLHYKDYELTLEPGTKLFLYTDGLPEATDKKGKMFGTDRLLRALNADPDAEPAQLLKNVHHSVDSFVKDAEQFDDLTMLCMEFKGKTAGTGK